MNASPGHSSGSRREFLAKAGCGFGALALADLLAADTKAQGQDGTATGGSRLERAPGPRRPHLRPRARSVIFLFMEGGPSHLDTFDPKSALDRLAGRPIPDSFGEVITAMGEFRSPILPSRRTWKQHGQSGLWISDWLPQVAQCADELAVIRSCWADGINHSTGVCQMNTGSILAGRPSLGSWVSYGLGTENANLPAFVVLQDTPAQVINGPRNWGAGFMPAVHQGVRMQGGSEPIPHLNTPEGLTAAQQQGKLGFLDRLNRRFAAGHPEQTGLEARIASYELAFQLQRSAPDALDLSQESAATLESYGVNQSRPDDHPLALGPAPFGRQCLIARRLVERGVRFIQIYHGGGHQQQNWDAHNGVEENLRIHGPEIDRPIAALLADLEQRGLLDSTLIVWGGEFGRQAVSQGGNGGRDHNPKGFTYWLAGGGVRGGTSYGETDELGHEAAVDRHHIRDLHATILHLMGLDPQRLTYFYGGLDQKLTGVVEPEVIRRILA